MLPDYHIHTRLCKHAEGEPAEYRGMARIMGLPAICITDHCPTPDGYDPAHRMALEQFPAYRRAVEDLRGNAGPEVLFGIEADYYPGCEGFLREWLPRQGFDLVIGSVHLLGDWGFDNPEESHRWKSADVTATWRAYFSQLRALVATGLYDLIGHLDLVKKFGYRPPDEALVEMAQPLMDALAKAGMGIELNTAGLRKPVGEIYPSPLLLAMACERGIPICFGSDAHTPLEVGADFDQALLAAREAGYDRHFTIRQRVKQSAPLPSGFPGL